MVESDPRGVDELKRYKRQSVTPTARARSATVSAAQRLSRRLWAHEPSLGKKDEARTVHCASRKCDAPDRGLAYPRGTKHTFSSAISKKADHGHRAVRRRRPD